MNRLGSENKPFLFIIDYCLKNMIVLPFDISKKKGALFDINGLKNYSDKIISKEFEITVKPVSYKIYKRSYDIVQKHLRLGNSYLVNLTFPTEIETNYSLEEIFFSSSAKYKLLYKDLFTVFSPETFVKIIDGKIYSYPMKGTIKADKENAEEILLKDEKEIAEHITIVDLIRNDLNMVAHDIKVLKFRYIDRLKTSRGEILQTSSEICGTLPQNYNEKIGDIISALLPAGSITGAPKKSTIDIIKESEIYDRGFYTGIFGYFDGKNLDSAVMIRFIEKSEEKLFFKSGGGITVYSDPESEYQEMIDKVYAQIN